MSGSPSHPRVRRSLADLQQDYAAGRKKPLEDLVRVWKGIRDLPARDPRSFFVLGGYHGEPFRDAGWGDNAYWGGYCQHGNVLFPLWHRIFLFQVGQTIPNPLRSYTLPVNVVDRISGDKPNYSKAAGYETVRYPYSGLVGTPEDRAATAQHNARWTYPQSVTVLNANITAWLNQETVIDGKTISTGIYQAYADSLDAPNYTVFSNNTAAAHWNRHRPQPSPPARGAVGGAARAPGGDRPAVRHHSRPRAEGPRLRHQPRPHQRLLPHLRLRRGRRGKEAHRIGRRPEPSARGGLRELPQTHLLAGASFPLHGLDPEQLGADAITVEVRTHGGLLGGRPRGPMTSAQETQPHFRVEVR